MMESLAENVGAERIGRIIETYLGELTQRLDAITAAHKVSNSDGVAKEAHPLKSSSAEIGALRLSALAAAIEAAARSGNCAAAADIALLQKTADETRKQLMSSERVVADNTGTDRN